MGLVVCFVLMVVVAAVVYQERPPVASDVILAA